MLQTMALSFFFSSLKIKGWLKHGGITTRSAGAHASFAEPLSIMFERSWRTGEVPEDWRRANVIPIFKKGKKEDSGNYRLVSLTSIPGKVMEQLILDVISKPIEVKKVIRSSQQGKIMLDQSDSLL